MGRDTIQLENAVSTVSQEYLLEFTSEYGIPEGLHPELPSPEDTIVDFPEGKIVFPTVVDWRTSAPKDEMPTVDSYLAGNVTMLNTRCTPIQTQPEALLCLVGLSRNYLLGDDEYPTFLYDDGQEMDLFNLISAPNPFKVKTRIRPCAAHEVPLLTVTANRVIEMKDPRVASGSSGTPLTVERSPMDFDNENPVLSVTEGTGAEEEAQDGLAHEEPPKETTTTTRVVQEAVVEEEIDAVEPLINKRRKQLRRKRGNEEVEVNALPKVLRKDHASGPAQSTTGGKTLASMGMETGVPIITPTSQEIRVDVSDPDPLSYAKPQSVPEQDIAQSSKGTTVVGDPESEKSSSFTFIIGSPGGIYQSGWGVTNNCRLDTSDVCQDVVDHIVPSGYFSELRHLPNNDFLSQYNINLARQVAMGSKLRMRFEQEVRLRKRAMEKIAKQEQRIQVREEEIKRLDAEVKSLKVVETEVHGLRNQAQNLKTLLEAEAQVTGEEKIKAAFEELKRLEDEKVEQRCMEMDAWLDVMSINFDEELYPHMLTAIVVCRWVIGHGLRLAGMSEGLKYGVEHRGAKLDLAALGAYDPEAEGKYIAALTALRYMKYPLVDQLEQLNDAPIDLLMASLHLESDTREDAPPFIHDLRPNSSQLKIHVYPEVRDLKNPWAVKEEMLLEDDVAANISRAEKKRKCRIFCRTHGVGSAHHARSDDVPVSVLIVIPQGLQILLEDAAT
ncbi:hypothetical protein Tco_0563718 [Tanacetum coccineum]